MPLKKLLVVDDNETQCKTLSFILKRKGYDVSTAYDGFKALDLVRELQFDIIFMDIRMPDMDGVETLKKIKEIQSGPLIVMMTAYADDERIKDGLELGAHGVFYKPLDIGKVLDFLKQISLQGSNNRILVIDDEQCICNLFKRIFALKGYDVDTVNNGEDALKYVRCNKYDLVFIDMIMPNMNGIEIFDRLKKECPDIQVVLMTGYVQDTEELIENALNNGAYTCLYKPFETVEILMVTEEVLEKNTTEVGPGLQ